MRSHWTISPAAAALAAAFATAHAYGGQHPAAGADMGAGVAAATTDADRTSHAGAAYLLDGYSAGELIGLDARGRSSRSIGAVRDVALGRDGRVTAVLVDTRGILGFGESTFRVPWSDVTIDAQAGRVHVPLDESRLALYRWDIEAVRTRPGEVLASNLIGGGLALRDGRRAGEVNDLVIGRDGTLRSLIVASTLHGGEPDRYAYPFGGRMSFNAGAQIYTADLGWDEARRLPALGGFEGAPSAIGATNGAAAGGELRSSGTPLPGADGNHDGVVDRDEFDAFLRRGGFDSR